MSFVVWILIGLAAGFTGSRLPNTRADSMLPDIPLGVAGAVAAGWLYYTFGPVSENGLHIVSLLAACFGSLAFLLAYHALRRIRSVRDDNRKLL
jgi:uncharacterized membrane protein YeaQ/YmgE (transglycosylase-associated protein family)